MPHCREIEALYLGRLRQVRPLSECLCAGNYPVLQANDSNVCLAAVPFSNLSKPRLVDNIGGRLSKLDASRRVDDRSEMRTRRFLAEYVNDGDLTTAWASPVHFNDSATIHIDVGHEILVSNNAFLLPCFTG